MSRSRLFLSLAAGAIFAVPTIHAQSVFGTNLIVNGDAESGGGGNGSKPVASIPGWTVNNGADVLTYASTYGLTTGDVVPIAIGKNYFAGGHNASSSISQSVSLASGASTIDAGGVTFAAIWADTPRTRVMSKWPWPFKTPEANSSARWR
jgi:hypothetical protein